MDFTNKKILIYGMGISGKGAVSLLKDEDADIVLYDANVNLNKDALFEELGLPADTKLILGSLSDEDLKNVDVLTLSPGVSVFSKDVEAAKKNGVEIMGEIELAYEMSKGRMAAITGTNGKTTTTALTGEIMKASFEDVYVVGNIGRSFAEVARQTNENSVIVAEISSFQLEAIKDFHPCVTAILNLTPDHLDRHGTFENYALTKLLIAKNQTPSEKCILNYDDLYLRELSKNLTPEIIWFSRNEDLEKGVCLDGDAIVWKDGLTKQVICHRSELHLMGNHNVENVMAACAISLAMGAELSVISKVVKDFRAVEHRIEYTCTRSGVSYYNDSKGTNTDAAGKAVSSMVAPTILIAGGYDKGADFTEWIEGFDGKVKAMLLIGQTAEKIRQTAEKCGFHDTYMCTNLEEAVAKAADMAQPGDAVLLSPACASWGQFKNYEERGRLFKEYANRLEDHERN